MKICPKCSFSNGEEFATCCWCNRSLAGVPSTPPADPNHPEYEKWGIQKKRSGILRRQLAEAVLLYALAITFSVLAGLGYAWNRGMLLCAFVSGILVAGAVLRRMVGQLTAPLLQGALSVALIFYFEFGTPIMFFTLAGHAFAAVLLCIWVDLIYDANR